MLEDRSFIFFISSMHASTVFLENRTSFDSINRSLRLDLNFSDSLEISSKNAKNLEGNTEIV